MYRMGKEEIDAVARVITSKQLFMENEFEQEVVNFENEWEEKIGVKYAICISGGTCALIAALAALEIGPGDEVIVPAYTFMATASAVLAVGAIPVLADIDDSLTLDPMEIERKLSPNTKAVIPVHMVGFPCNMSEINRIAKKHNLKVLEDACQADGGSFKGKRLGSWGDAGAFSFNYYKIISAGEGGAVVTNDRKVYERATIYHDGGTAFRHHAGGLLEPIFIGNQFRVSEITGAILRVQTRRLDGILNDLRKIKKTFMDALAGLPGVVFARSNDIEGDCGTTLPFAFDDEKTARLFAKSDGVNGWLPIDSGKHVYTEWTPILEKAGGHHPLTNPYNLPQNKDLNADYSDTVCRKSLDIMSRTVYISMNPDWTEDEINTRIEACKTALTAIFA